MSQTAVSDLETTLDAFERVIKNKPNEQDSVAERTANSYRRNVRFFVEWLEEERNKGMLEADTSDLRVYLRHTLLHAFEIRAKNQMMLQVSLNRVGY